MNQLAPQGPNLDQPQESAAAEPPKNLRVRSGIKAGQNGGTGCYTGNHNCTNILDFGYGK